MPEILDREAERHRLSVLAYRLLLAEMDRDCDTEDLPPVYLFKICADSGHPVDAFEFNLAGAVARIAGDLMKRGPGALDTLAVITDRLERLLPAGAA